MEHETIQRKIKVLEEENAKLKKAGISKQTASVAPLPGAKKPTSTIDRVNMRATTNEKLGFIGRGDGIAALAVAALDIPE
jgi:hypothetical protein